MALKTETFHTKSPAKSLPQSLGLCGTKQTEGLPAQPKARLASFFLPWAKFWGLAGKYPLSGGHPLFGGRSLLVVVPSLVVPPPLVAVP